MTYGTSHAVLKPLAEVNTADPRMEHLIVRRGDDQRKFELSDMHKRVSTISIHNGVPPDVQRQFETARNLMLYTWFVFEFQTCSEQQAYGALELALRRRFPDAKKVVPRKDGTIWETPLTLAGLLQKAFNEKAIIPEQLTAWKRAAANNAAAQLAESGESIKPISANDWMNDVLKILPNFRNHLAHGEPRLDLFASLQLIELCAELINALFPEPENER